MRRVLPVAGPPLLWFGSQQGLSFILHTGCPSTSLVAILLLLLGCAPIGLALCATAHRWLALLWAGIFSLAIAFQGLGMLILGGCAS